MQDPYKVLGVPRDADMDEIKKAYRTLSRKYHPDANINNPNKEQAEEMFKQVQQAYDQIVDEREHGTAGSTAGGYGNTGGYGSYGGFGGFGGYGYGRTGSSAAQDPKLQAVLNYLNSRHYTEALHVLEDIPERTAVWYYYHAIANAGIGNNVNATEDAKRAASMEPENMQYQQLYSQLSGANDWYQDMGRGYGYEDCQTSRQAGPGSLCTMCMACMVMNLCCCGPYGGVICC
ncbi:MAG: DnaJ domain-containing protein [Eubacterium sp.]|nr:DnaJ domain-containing protein [Eubacterium sp.]